MAFEYKNLNVMSYTNGFTVWHYITDDVLSELESVNKYFAPVLNYLIAVGDLIVINAGGVLYWRYFAKSENGWKLEKLK